MVTIQEIQSKSPEILTFLEKNQWNSFYRSLSQQMDKKGYLSEKQIECLENGLKKSIERQENTVKPSTYPVGQEIEIKKWLANLIRSELNLSFFFRNLVIAENLRETHRAIQVKVRFNHKIMSSCHVCGRGLDNPISQAVGIGPICASKLGLKRPTLESAQETLEQIEEIAKGFGIIGPIWIPKSQIKPIYCEFEDEARVNL